LGAAARRDSGYLAGDIDGQARLVAFFGGRSLPGSQMRYIVLALDHKRGRPSEEQMATASGLRVGDADREAAAEALREHYAEGRLTLEEFQQRLELVFAAKTDRDLAAITGDLPHAAPPLAWPPIGARRSDGSRDWQARTGPRRRSALAASAGFIVVMLALVLIAFILPVAFIGTVIARSLLFALLALLFGRRGILRKWRRWLPRSARRRWPF
jgi:Domain of unknown function (DUF1707)